MSCQVSFWHGAAYPAPAPLVFGLVDQSNDQDRLSGTQARNFSPACFGPGAPLRKLDVLRSTWHTLAHPDSSLHTTFRVTKGLHNRPLPARRLYHATNYTRVGPVTATTTAC